MVMGHTLLPLGLWSNDRRMEIAMLSARLVNAATLVIALGTGSIAKADIATDWNAIAIEATAVPPNSILQSRVLAITHAAMYDAARLINQKAALFAAGIQPDAPNSLEVAVAAAAHTVLRRLAPAQSAALDAARAVERCRRTAKDERGEARADGGRNAIGIACYRWVHAEGGHQVERWARLLSIDPTTLHAADLRSVGRG